MSKLTKPLLAAIAATGATIDEHESGDWYVINVDAPAGKKWIDGGASALLTEWRLGQPWSREEKSEALDELRERVKCGLRNATTAELREECDE